MVFVGSLYWHLLCFFLLIPIVSSFQRICFKNMYKQFQRFNVKNMHTLFDNNSNNNNIRSLSYQSNIVISSKSNDKVKLVKSLDTAKSRLKHNMIKLEGHRQVIDALRLGFIPSCVMFCQRALDAKDQSTSAVLKQELSEALSTCDPNGIVEVSESIMSDICDTVSNQGIVAGFVKPKAIKELKVANSNKANVVLVLDGVSDPGNMGSLIRSAVGFGVSCIVTVGGVDIWSPKVIRSSMGLILRCPILEFRLWNEFEAEFVKYQSGLPSPIQMYLADGGENSEVYHKCSYASADSLFVVIGSEAFGISDAARDAAKQRLSGKFIKIPMNSDVESLNAAVAGSIILSEIQRQQMVTS